MAGSKYGLVSVVSVADDDSAASDKTRRNHFGVSRRRERFNYKPLALRTLSLSSLLVLTLALIALLQYAAVKLPHTGHHIDRRREISTPTMLSRRQVGNESTASLPTDLTSSSIAETDYLNTDYTQTISTTSSTALLLISTTLYTTDSADYLNTDYTQTISTTSSTALLPISTTVYSTDQSDYLSTGYSQTDTPATTTAESSAYLNTDYTQTVTPATSTTESAAYLNTDYTQTEMLVTSTVSADYLNTDCTQTISSVSSSVVPAASVPAFGTDSAAYLDTDYTQTVSSTSSSVGSMASAAATNYLTTDYTQTLGLVVPAASATPTDSLDTDSSMMLSATASGDYHNIDNTQASFISTSTGNLLGARPTTVHVNADHTQTIASTTATKGTPTSFPNTKGEVEVHTWSGGQTFVSTYLAVTVAVLYRMLWTLVCSSFALIEPFRQLAHAHGALAEHAFFHLYQSPTKVRSLFHALTNRNWTFALVASTYLVLSFLPAIASETLMVSTQWDCPNPRPGEPSDRNPCYARMEIRLGALRVLQLLLALAAATLVVAISVLLTTKTGLTADPAAMATVATLMGHPDLARDLHQVPRDATAGEMRTVMEGKRYYLGFYETANGQSHYGIRPMHEQRVDATEVDIGYAPFHDSPGGARSSAARDPSIWRWSHTDSSLTIALLGTFGVVLGYYLDGRNDGFNRFFSSNTFGPRFILASAGTAIATLWKSAEQRQVVLAPYARLAQRPSSPSSTLLFTPSHAPIVSTYKALRSRYFFTALLTLATFSAEVLNIVVSGVPYASAQTWLQFLVSAYMSLGILGFMTLVLGLMLFFARRRELRLPRRPDTLGAVMSYLSGSRMLDDFDGYECEAESERRSRLKRLGKKYELRKGIRSDGTVGYAVDDMAEHAG